MRWGKVNAQTLRGKCVCMWGVKFGEGVQTQGRYFNAQAPVEGSLHWNLKIPYPHPQSP